MENIFIKSALHQFQSYCDRLTHFLEKLPAEKLNDEVAPGKNTGLYLVGHLVAVNETMVTLFGLGEKQFPELEIVFVQSPDKSIPHAYTDEKVRNIWKQHSNYINQQFAKLSEKDWMEKHSALSEEDFKSQPHRNKFNVLLNRINHLNYHLGQLGLL